MQCYSRLWTWGTRHGHSWDAHKELLSVRSSAAPLMENKSGCKTKETRSKNLYIYISLDFHKARPVSNQTLRPSVGLMGPRRNRARRTSRRGAFLAGLRQQAHDLQEVVTEISPRGSQEGWRRCSICPSFFEVLNQIESETLQPYQVIVH